MRIARIFFLIQFLFDRPHLINIVFSNFTILVSWFSYTLNSDNLLNEISLQQVFLHHAVVVLQRTKLPLQRYFSDFLFIGAIPGGMPTPSEITSGSVHQRKLSQNATKTKSAYRTLKGKNCYKIQRPARQRSDGRYSTRRRVQPSISAVPLMSRDAVELRMKINEKSK